MANYIHFRTEHCEKYALYEKTLQIKVVEHWSLYKKVSGLICLSPPKVELGNSKDYHLWNIIMYQNGKRVAQLKRKLATNFFVTQIYTHLHWTRTAGVWRVSTQRSEQLWQWVQRICWWKRVLLHWKNTRYSMEEWVFMLTKYISMHSFASVHEAFKNEFPESGEPPDSTISRMFQKFLNTGNVLAHPRACVCTTQMTTNPNHISDSVDDAPRLSTRRCAVSKSLLNSHSTLVERIKAVAVLLIAALGIETVRLSAPSKFLSLAPPFSRGWEQFQHLRYIFL